MQCRHLCPKVIFLFTEGVAASAASLCRLAGTFPSEDGEASATSL